MKRLTLSLLLSASLLAVGGCSTNSGMESTPTFTAARMLPTPGEPPRPKMAHRPYTHSKPPRAALNGGVWTIDNVHPTQAYDLPLRLYRVTLVVLPEGESVNKALGGDVDAFVVEGAFVDNRAAIAITPMIPGRKTNLIVTTTGGTRSFMLSSTEYGGWLGQVDVNVAAPIKPPVLAMAPTGQYERLAVTPKEGPMPAWAPVEVWADANKMVARFPEPMPLLPALFAGQDGEQVVNYRVHRSPGYVHLVTDRRVTFAELRIEGEVVTIAPAEGNNGNGVGWQQAGRMSRPAEPSFSVASPNLPAGLTPATEPQRHFTMPPTVEIETPPPPVRSIPTI